MKLFAFLIVALAPLPLMAELNGYEILMFFDMYRSDYEQNGSKSRIANGCNDCGLSQFLRHIDRFNTFNPDSVNMDNTKDPEVGDVLDWELNADFVYDAKKLLGRLWRDQDNKSRPGHPTVIERLVDRLEEMRQSGDPARLEHILDSMEWAHLSRRKSQSKEMLEYIRDRLVRARLTQPKTKSISFIQGNFDEFDSEATIRSVQLTKRSALRKELVDIAKEINSGSLSKSGTKRDLDVRNQLKKRDAGDDMAIASLQRGIDGLKMPPRKKC
ncbi:hypothetical protein LIA77_03452 [Sarocladium implicatum]|jgi:predicted  nucleic acid-binding Zn-ribbon protein|nr:hypothetical protein LIA77_03452 [Sarocladium implicatum]